MQKTEKNIQLPEHILRMMRRLEEAGKEVYLVGGSLRDLLLGISPHDYDLATSALPEQTMEIFFNCKVITTGLKHGTVTVMEKNEGVEITTFRMDGTYHDARHPDCVTFTGCIEKDLSRRDFTVNAMAYHPKLGLVDPYGGKKDLSNKILRAVGEPEIRFSEDALRILRAFRFCAQLGFTMEQNTLEGCHYSKSGLTKVAKERIASEFLRLLLSFDPEPSLQKMIETEVISFVIKNYLPSSQILSNIKKMPAIDTARLGFFLADCETESARMLLKELKYSNKQIMGACAVIQGAKQTIQSSSDARRCMAAYGIYADDACLASVLLGNSPKEALAWMKQKKAATSVNELNLSGTDLMALGLSGKQIGEVLQEILRLVLEDPTFNEKEKMLAWVQKNYYG